MTKKEERRRELEAQLAVVLERRGRAHRAWLEAIRETDELRRKLRGLNEPLGATNRGRLRCLFRRPPSPHEARATRCVLPRSHEGEHVDREGRRWG